jgi:hypothetical protein
MNTGVYMKGNMQRAEKHGMTIEFQVGRRPNLLGEN